MKNATPKVGIDKAGLTIPELPSWLLCFRKMTWLADDDGCGIAYCIYALIYKHVYAIIL